jgi:hypothetical protein
MLAFLARREHDLVQEVLPLSSGLSSLPCPIVLLFCILILIPCIPWRLDRDISLLPASVSRRGPMTTTALRCSHRSARCGWVRVAHPSFSLQTRTT